LIATAGVAVLIVAAAVARIALFADLEPRMDHAFSIQWVQSLRAAERFGPEAREGSTWLAALAADDRGWLHALLRPIRAASLLVLTLGAQAWFYLGSFPAGAGTSGQVALSVVAHAGAAGLLGMIGFSAGGAPLALGAVALATLSSFMHAFAPLGAHNVALLAMMGTLWAMDRLLRAAARPEGADPGMALAAFGLQALALNTYYSVVFLVPPAFILALLFSGRIPPRIRARLGMLHLAATAAALLPAALVVAAELASRAGDTKQAFAFYLTWGWDPVYIGADNTVSWAGAARWFEAHARVFSVPGVALGLAGSVWLAATGRAPLPLAVLLAHFAVWVAMPGFRQFDRTAVYAVPFLALGTAAAALAAWRTRRAAARAAFALALAWHVAVDNVRLADPGKFPAWGEYYRRQGEFRAMMRDIAAAVPADAVLSLWDYGLTHRWRSLAYGSSGPKIATPAQVLAAREANPPLPYPPSGIEIPRGFYVLAPEDAAFDSTRAASIVCGGQPSCPSVRIDKVLARPHPDDRNRALALYRVDWET
jgi:hypothetical protein